LVILAPSLTRIRPDQYTSGTYNTYATSQAFEKHSLLATINVIRAIFQSISQPPMAKIADVFGRVNAYILSVFLYALGYVIQASAPSIYVSRACYRCSAAFDLRSRFAAAKAYAVGNAIYILGITSLFLLRKSIASIPGLDRPLKRSLDHLRRKYHHLRYLFPSEPCLDDHPA
jgi:SIT family siderophore-iron:H+ symporter-like MFS transporter